VADVVTSRVLADGSRHRPGVKAPAVGLAGRRCACGGHAGVDGECAQCRAKRLARQRAAGRPLEQSTRRNMEARFGRDLGAVRIHTGSEAAASAQALGAAAYTLGQTIVFNANRYAPQTPSGRRLIAHEVAHVIQQERGGPPASTAHEQEAARAGALAVGHDRGRVEVLRGAHGVQRQPLASSDTEPQQNKPPAPDAQDTAAIEGLKKVMCKSAKDGFEHCGLVIDDGSGAFSTTPPVTQRKVDSCSAQTTADKRVVAYYHSHPAGQGDDFSEWDRDKSEDTKWDWYLVGPKAGMKRLIPSRDERRRGTTKELGTAPECP
jgi:proteasome lid subunit RPN8/RPN11